MRILLGPYESNSPEALELEAADKPFATPFEVADLAVRLAQMKGKTEPDLVGAAALLMRAWKKCKSLTQLESNGLHFAFDVNTGAAMALASPVYRNTEFPGAELISEPSNYPVDLDSAVRLISGEYSRERRREFLLRLENYLREAMGRPLVDEVQSSFSIKDRADFWTLARRLAPHCPKFAKYYRSGGVKKGSVRKSRPEKSRKVKKSS
jgi:hypothetical protein